MALVVSFGQVRYGGIYDRGEKGIIMHAYFGDHTPLAFAHRGGGLENAENTMEAFQHAVSLGFSYIETDAQVTADGVLVLFHDLSLKRLTGADGKVRDHNWSDLKALKVLGAGTIPRVEDVLSAWPHVKLNIDAKVAEAVVPLCDFVQRRNAFDHVCLASFDMASITEVRTRLGAAVCTGAAMSEAARFVMEARLGLKPAPVAANCLQLPPRSHGLNVITPRVLNAAHEAGKQVHAWTIDERDEVDVLLDQGVDGIMTDRPTMLKETLAQREVWA